MFDCTVAFLLLTPFKVAVLALRETVLKSLTRVNHSALRKITNVAHQYYQLIRAVVAKIFEKWLVGMADKLNYFYRFLKLQVGN